MSNSNTLERATGRLFTEMLPELAGINYGDTDGAAALALEIIRFTESDIHNPSSSNNLDF